MMGDTQLDAISITEKRRPLVTGHGHGLTPATLRRGKEDDHS